MKRLPLLVVLGLLAIAIAVPLSGGQLGLGSTGPTPSGSGLAVGSASPPPGTSPIPATPAATEPGSAAPSPTAAPPETPETPAPTPVFADVAVVPVTHFRTTRAATDRAEVEAVLAGTSRRYEVLELVEADADAILAALELSRPTDTTRLRLAKDADALRQHLAKNRKWLGVLRADDVTPAVRALGWGEQTLFGVNRVTAAGDWPLMARLEAPDGTDPFDPGSTWTLFAGGDILLDRGVYQTIAVNGKGDDFPFDGGTAEVTGTTCCSQFGWEVPTVRRTGNKGAMRELMTKADVAIANFEAPAPNTFRWHTSGTVFSSDRRHLDGLARAGLDYVSIANNHIGDAGRNGILQTIRNLEKAGIQVSGAGEDLAAARTPGILEANGTKVAVLAYDAIARYYHAQKSRAGSAPLTLKNVRQDIAAAREAGAEIVIVFPHWGLEYQSKPFANQQKLARRIIDEGADMVIGNHAHWAAALEVYEGKPIWYALGNFVFDQTWSQPTMEGITLELTFRGAELVQAKMRPHIIADKAQPNFLDENGDGRQVMGQVYDSSRGLLPW